MTGYVLRTGLVQHITPQRSEELVAKGEFEMVGTYTGGEWVGVPLIVEGRTIGVLAVQTYDLNERYADEDVALLAFVGRHVASALARAHAIDGIRQRNVELALIDEIGQGLVQHMDFAEIIELVGEGIREAYDASTMYVSLYDPATNVVTFPYEVEHGIRIATEPFELGPGLTSTVIRDRRPLRIGTSEDARAAGAIVVGDRISESWLGVPVLAGDDVLGVIALESYERHKFPEEMERLLAALASSVGVALSNARLFDETKRLLADTNQRAAELAVINEIGDALGRQLEFDAIIQLVGERVRELFSAGSMAIALHDPVTNMVSWPYDLDEGAVFHRDPRPLGPGLTSRVISSGRSLRVGTREEQDAAGALQMGGTDTASWLGVPIASANRVIGVLSLETPVENAYSADAGRARTGGRPPRRRVLARHARAARPRRCAHRRSVAARPRRAVERTRSGRHPVAA